MEEVVMGFEGVSLIAQQESWRKEIYRPMSYIHKWWARRLGSVFRGLIVFDHVGDSFSMSDYYNPPDMHDKVIFDPFMGSGTTVIEACKLGAKVVGCDINPIAANLVKTSLQKYSMAEVVQAYKKLETACADHIKSFYKTSSGEDVMYYLWVSTLECEDCGQIIPLHKSFIFSKNAYASKKTTAMVVCPICGKVFSCHYKDNETRCPDCEHIFNPQSGNVDKTNTCTCPVCGKKERVIDYVRRKKSRLQSKMYCKIVMRNGQKSYEQIDEFDLTLYHTASELLKNYEADIPDFPILQGINTKQIINYGYCQWRDMFNDRQLLSIVLLAKQITSIEDESLRMLFGVLLSGTMEFNNMFCSYKGEGTGAVRPLFYNHILKPELTPLEANLWGTNSSSGAFSSFFQSRVIRALQYKADPFEVAVSGDASGKYYLERLDSFVRHSEFSFNDCNASAVLDSLEVNSPVICCQDSASLPIPDETVDLVLTDPPFFDNVNYSELADFFFAWQSKWGLGFAANDGITTRQLQEVQDSQAEAFGNKLGAVFTNCRRVLKPEGKLIFTYHHSRIDGWLPVYHAITQAGFQIENTILVKAEMSVSVAIMAARQPINYDLVFVCAKHSSENLAECSITDVYTRMQAHLSALMNAGLVLSDGDKMMLIYGKVLEFLSKNHHDTVTMDMLDMYVDELTSIVFQQQNT